MHRRLVRVLAPVSLVLGIGLGACETTEPEELPEPVIHETARFRIADYSSAPQSLIDQIGDRLETEFDRVGTVMPDFDPPPTPVPFNLFPGGGLAYVTPAENSITQWREDLALEYFTHQLAHLYTGYQQTEFIEEGLAVYVNEELRLEGEAPNPFRLQVPHAWVALFQQHQSTIPLAIALDATNLGYSYDGSSIDASAWQLFIEAASFTRWMIETYGRVPWHQFYLSGDPTTVLTQDLAEIQQAWLDHATTAHPNPTACEEALGTVGSREAFWCARARGE